MSQSSLPEIFKKSFTTPTRAEKIGGSFSLYLNSYSTEKYAPSRAGYAPGQNQYASVAASKGKSMSMYQPKHKQSILKEINTKINDERKSKIRVSFKANGQFGTSIPLKQKIGLSVVNTSNFPYESSRRFNNSTFELQEVDNIQNMFGSAFNQLQLADKCLGQIKNQTNQTKNALYKFFQDLQNDFGDFTSQFQQSLKQCYSHLSSFRRETNEQIKSNKLNLEKLKGQINICSSFLKDLLNKSDNLYTECIKTSDSSDYVKEFSKSNGVNMDFQELSSIKKSSRGATGDQSKRSQPVELLKSNPFKRKSANLKLSTPKSTDNKFILNGKEIEMLKLEGQF